MSAPAQITNATTSDGFLSSVVGTALDATHGCQINHNCILRPGTALVASGITMGANGSLGICGKATLTLGAAQATQSILRIASVGYVEQSSGSGATATGIPKGLVG